MVDALKKKTKDPYGLHPTFEAAVVHYCTTSAQFWSLVGSALDPDRMELPYGKLAVECVRSLTKDLGRHPASLIAVLQRMMAAVQDGRVAQSEVEAFGDAMEAATALPLPDYAAVAEVLVPVVRQHMHSDAILISHQEFARKGDMSVVAEMLHKAANLGRTAVSPGTQVGLAAYDIIERVKNMPRMTTGILELDLLLCGGMPVKQLGVAVAASGGGKSQFLTTQTAAGMRSQLFCGHVSLELPEHIQMARLQANLTGVSTNAILDDDVARAESRRRLEQMLPHLGICEMVDMPPGATTVRDLRRWVDEKEQKHGIKMRHLTVDYADKLTDPRVKDRNQYREMGDVYEALRRDLAHDRDMWVWTASQSSRQDKKHGPGKVLDIDDISDSINKVRVADVVVTLNPQEDETVSIYLAKFRTGRGRLSCGPMLTDFDRARFTPHSSEFGPWGLM